MRQYLWGAFSAHELRSENLSLCVVEVWYAHGWHQCTRQRGHGRDGVLDGLLCKQHARLEAEGKKLNIPEDKL